MVVAIRAVGTIAISQGFGGIVLLRRQETASQRVCEFEVGPVGPRLPDDGGAARDDVPNHVISNTDFVRSARRAVTDVRELTRLTVLF